VTELSTIDKLPPVAELGFGRFYSPKMAVCSYSQGQWGEPSLKKLDKLSIHPGAKTLHYSQEIFEGMKAYLSPQGPLLFRPYENIKRMARSAEIMRMPAFPQDKFFSMIKDLVLASKHLVPEEPGSLYLRPTMIGTTPFLGVNPSDEYLFFIVASPVGGYYGGAPLLEPAQIKIVVSEEVVRAAPGGVGAAKTGGNYGASLRILGEVRARGYNDVLFLDARESTFVEELSGMNFFIVEEGVLKTPPLSDTILAGVTRDSLIKLARRMGVEVREEAINIKELVAKIASGQVSEAFSCGTAAVITSIKGITRNDVEHIVGNGVVGELSNKLYQALLAMQYGKSLDAPDSWVVNLEG